jgi:NitT/TauT family transport system permease protein
MTAADTDMTNAPRAVTLQRFLSRWGSPALILGIVAVWQLLTWGLGIPIYIVPQPVLLFTPMAADASALWWGWVTTTIHAVTGFVIGNLFSVMIAFIITWSSTARSTILPVALAIKSTPMVAITPIITLVVGFGSSTVITVAAIVCFFPTLVNVSRGLRAAPRGTLELMRILDASEIQTFFKVRLPYALPYLFTALRITVPAAFGSSMVAEYIASNSGLGYLIQDSYTQFRFVLVWQVVVVATVTTLAAFIAVTRLEHAVLSRRGQD